MTKLTSKSRNALPSSSFGLPGRRAYPMPDASHARNAKARASQAVNAGRMSKSTEEKIDMKADKVMGHNHEHKALHHATKHLESHRGHRHHHD